jgi:hypothetical protein
VGGIVVVVVVGGVVVVEGSSVVTSVKLYKSDNLGASMYAIVTHTVVIKHPIAKATRQFLSVKMSVIFL